MIKNVLIVLLFCLPFTGFAQYEKDQFWSGIEFNHQLNKKVDYSIRTEYRSIGFEDPLNKLIEIGSGYKLNKYVNLKAGARFADVYEDDDKLRLNADLILKWSKKKWPLKVQYRNRLQHIFLAANEDHYSIYRAKFKFSWKLMKKFYFYSGFEYFFKFGQKDKWNGERFFIGLNKKFKKGVGGSLAYIIDEGLNKKHVEIERAIVIGLSYNLKKKSKSKKD